MERLIHKQVLEGVEAGHRRNVGNTNTPLRHQHNRGTLVDVAKNQKNSPSENLVSGQSSYANAMLRISDSKVQNIEKNSKAVGETNKATDVKSRPEGFDRHGSKDLSSCPRFSLKLVRYLEDPLVRDIWECLNATISFLSCLNYVVSTYSSSGSNPYDTEYLVSTVIDAIFTFYFIIDYILFVMIVEDKLRYVTSVLPIFDLLSILPIIPESIGLVEGIHTGVIPFFVIYFGFLRAFRMFRLLRLVRAYRIIPILKDGIARRVFQLICMASSCLFLMSGFVTTLSQSNPENFIFGARILTFDQSFYFSVVTIATLGYGDIYPSTAFARMFIVLVVCLSIVFIPVWAAEIWGLCSARSEYQTQQFTPYKGFTHVVICGKPEFRQLRRIIGQIYHAERSLSNRHVVLLSPDDPSPQVVVSLLNDAFLENRLVYIRGTPLSDADLYRAGCENAEALIILPYLEAVHPSEEDAMNILAAEQIRRINPDTNIILEIIKHESLDLVRSNLLKQVQILCLEAFTYNLLSQSLEHPGLHCLLCNLMRHFPDPKQDKQRVDPPWILEYNLGCSYEIYSICLPATLDSATFSDCQRSIFKLFGVCIIGLERKIGYGKPELYFNPGSNFEFRRGDCAIILARSVAHAEFLEDYLHAYIRRRPVDKDSEKVLESDASPIDGVLSLSSEERKPSVVELPDALFDGGNDGWREDAEDLMNNPKELDVWGRSIDNVGEDVVTFAANGNSSDDALQWPRNNASDLGGTMGDMENALNEGLTVCTIDNEKCHEQYADVEYMNDDESRREKSNFNEELEDNSRIGTENRPSPSLTIGDDGGGVLPIPLPVIPLTTEEEPVLKRGGIVFEVPSDVQQHLVIHGPIRTALVVARLLRYRHNESPPPLVLLSSEIKYSVDVDLSDEIIEVNDILSLNTLELANVWFVPGIVSRKSDLIRSGVPNASQVLFLKGGYLSSMPGLGLSAKNEFRYRVATDEKSLVRNSILSSDAEAVLAVSLIRDVSKGKCATLLELEYATSVSMIPIYYECNDDNSSEQAKILTEADRQTSVIQVNSENDDDDVRLEPSAVSSIIAAGRVFEPTMIDAALTESLFQFRYLDIMRSLFLLNSDIATFPAAKYLGIATGGINNLRNHVFLSQIAVPKEYCAPISSRLKDAIANRRSHDDDPDICELWTNECCSRSVQLNLTKRRFKTLIKDGIRSMKKKKSSIMLTNNNVVKSTVVDVQSDDSGPPTFSVNNEEIEQARKAFYDAKQGAVFPFFSYCISQGCTPMGLYRKAGNMGAPMPYVVGCLPSKSLKSDSVSMDGVSDGFSLEGGYVRGAWLFEGDCVYVLRGSQQSI